MWRKIETQYGKAQRIWVMDRGVPSEETLADMRAADPPVLYLDGTPKGRPLGPADPIGESAHRPALEGRAEGVGVKLLPQDNEL